MKKTGGPESRLVVLAYAAAFLLIWEWIRPLKQISEVSNTTWFTVFAGLSLLLYLLPVPWYLTSIMKWLYILIALDKLYQLGTAGIITSLLRNTGLLFSRDWYQFTNDYRSFLLFILFWILTCLIHCWVQVRKRLFFFVLITIVYVAVLDTFTPYDGKLPVIRTAAAGLFLLGVLFCERMLANSGAAKTGKPAGRWVFTLFIVIAGSVFIGYSFPKANPVWPDPVPFIKLQAGIAETGPTQTAGMKTAGLREDDSRLGGPFTGNNETVFRAKVKTEQYWRMEVKTDYTGKGWKQAGQNKTTEYNQGNNFFNLELGLYRGKDDSAVLTFNEPASTLFYPYGLTSFTDSSLGKLEFSEQTEKIRLRRKGVRTYSLQYKPQNLTVKELKESSPNNQSGNMSNGFYQQTYTQLPDSLPNRVRQLAKDITRGQKTAYDKAKAVEAYLQSGEFQYEQSDVATPQGSEDYVDQFLFESKKGYCDNFSSAMVVLLRAAGVPARWVKGYAPGTYEKSAGAYNVYKITHNDAHSWPEVYFYGIGWVPFEPTPGYSSTVSIQNDTSQQTSEESTTAAAQNETRTEQQQQKQQLAQEETQPASTVKKAEKSSLGKQIGKWLSHNLWIMIAGVVAAALAVWAVVARRKKWMPYFLLLKYRNKADLRHFEEAFLALLAQLERYGFKKPKGQTLREYAREVDAFFELDAMVPLTARYEALVYKKDNKDSDWQHLMHLWENLIKKTSG